MRGDVLRALAGPSRRVGNCQMQTVEEHRRMGGVEDTAIGLPISLLVLYPPPKRSCYPPAPILISNISVASFFVSGFLPLDMHCFLRFSSLVSHTCTQFDYRVEDGVVYIFS
jgi:hypothetical protein